MKKHLIKKRTYFLTISFFLWLGTISFASPIFNMSSPNFLPVHWWHLFSFEQVPSIFEDSFTVLTADDLDLDNDDDDEGILTRDEDTNGDGNYANDDVDNDGTPDYLDPTNDSTSIANENEVEVFNVLTPNGDGINDVLTIDKIEFFPNNTLEIVNRWGVLVYKVNGYNNSNTFFNGYANQGKVISKSKKLPTGTYFYKLQFKQEGNKASLTRTGYLYLTH